jgi:molecular chaperone DnaK (HSP70)
MRQFLVGIDLGTTHTVVAYARLKSIKGKPAAAPVIELLAIDQAVAAGQVAQHPLLPSVRYQAGADELAPGAHALPWATQTSSEATVMGQWARTLGAQVPGRLVTSAKSWLSHPAVDRLAPILPWGAPIEVTKVSPVEASASYLRHVRDAWNWQHPKAPLEQQDLVLTVPASFDEAARALTLSAARLAGLPDVRLLEEPQAAFYDWLLRHRDTLASDLAGSQQVLVCDVGGGTTDLSLIQVDWQGGAPQLTRIGVGKHLMLGGDNMDLALARLVESRLVAPVGAPAKAPLSAGQLAQLVERCRHAKEQLLATDAPAQVQVTLLGSGARLIGASRSVTLTRQDVEQLIVDGFFPAVDASAQAQQGRGGLVEFGLPYARDPAITRHLADFLRQQGHALPDTLLLNGGVFRAQALVQRLQHTLGAWRGAPLRLLHNDNPDVAVARGAVAYALAQAGLAPKMGGGSARSYFLVLDDAKGEGKGSRPQPRGICLLPRGSEPGQEIRLTGRTFALRLGQPVRFHLVTATAELSEQAPPQAGDLVDLTDTAGDHFAHLPPIVLVLQADAGREINKPAKPPARQQDTPVQLVVALTEVGTLEMHCISLNDEHQRWRLEFDLRHADADAPGAEAASARPATRLLEAIAHIDRIFGPGSKPVAAKEVKQLRAQLEQTLGACDHWATPELRALFDALTKRERARRRSPEHERVWLNLAGFCLRPGLGDPLDTWRVQQLWTHYSAGVQFASDKQVNAEWWTLWRRVAGGLAAPEQLRLLDAFAYNLQRNEQGATPDTAPPVRGSDDDMLRLGAALERIPPDYKTEIGDWLLKRLHKSLAKPRANASAGSDGLHLWALGRIGARQPFYGSPHDVVAPETAARWAETLLALDWKKLEPAAFATTHLARVTDDRARDLDPALRERIVARLLTIRAPTHWADMVRQRVELDEATQARMLGESLPPGLKLIG